MCKIFIHIYIYSSAGVNRKFMDKTNVKSEKDKEKVIKANRYRYFHVIIELGLLGPRLSLATESAERLATILIISGFVSQKMLETTLYNLKILDRSRKIFIENFDGQLQKGQQGVPYWNVYLQTTALITSRRLAKALSQKLFRTKNIVDPTIDVRPIDHFQSCKREELLSVPESSFYPGHFSLPIVRFEELLKNEEVKEAIKENPEKYKRLIENKK